MTTTIDLEQLSSVTGGSARKPTGPSASPPFVPENWGQILDAKPAPLLPKGGLPQIQPRFPIGIAPQK